MPNTETSNVILILRNKAPFDIQMFDNYNNSPRFIYSIPFGKVFRTKPFDLQNHSYVFKSANGTTLVVSSDYNQHYAKEFSAKDFETNEDKIFALSISQGTFLYNFL